MDDHSTCRKFVLAALAALPVPTTLTPRRADAQRPEVGKPGHPQRAMPRRLSRRIVEWYRSMRPRTGQIDMNDADAVEPRAWIAVPAENGGRAGGKGNTVRLVGGGVTPRTRGRATRRRTQPRVGAK